MILIKAIIKGRFTSDNHFCVPGVAVGIKRGYKIQNVSHGWYNLLSVSLL